MKVLRMVCLLGLGLGFAQEISQVNPNFVHAEYINIMTDEDTSFIWTNEVDLEDPAREGTLVWRCQYDGLNLIMRANEFLNSSGESAYVRYRFDDDEVEDWQIWDVNASNTAAVAPLEFVGPINSRFANAERVAVQTETYTGEVYTFVFNIAGFSEAISKLSCAQ